MQWIKQTFAVRFNVIVGRTGHVDGLDGEGVRYWSEILAGDSPEWAEEVDWEMVKAKVKTEIPAGMTYELSWDWTLPLLAGSVKRLHLS
jgi:hypothetical protein